MSEPRSIIRRGEVVVDDWSHLGEELPGDVEAVIVPLAELRDGDAKWRAWRGRLGVRIDAETRIEDLAADLARFALIAVVFPSPGEGRGYSQARLLRERYKFEGELRAVGAVKRDQLFLMARAGFDSFELAQGEDPRAASRSLASFSVAYQPGVGPTRLRS